MFAPGSSDSDDSDSIRQALEGARDALPITRWRAVVQALRLRPEQVRAWHLLTCGASACEKESGTLPGCCGAPLCANADVQP